VERPPPLTRREDSLLLSGEEKTPLPGLFQRHEAGGITRVLSFLGGKKERERFSRRGVTFSSGGTPFSSGGKLSKCGRFPSGGFLNPFTGKVSGKFEAFPKPSLRGGVLSFLGGPPPFLILKKFLFRAY